MSEQPIKLSAYGTNGPVSDVFNFNIDGQKVYETLDIDMNSHTYGKAIAVQTKVNGKLVDVSPNSELGLSIANDANSTRQTAYINKLSDISSKAENSGNSNNHEAALRNSGMYEMASGDFPYNVEIPAVEYVIEPGEVEGGGGSGGEETASNPVSAEKEKKFVGVYSYPYNAHYADRGGAPTQDHMKIDMFQYKAPQADYLTDDSGNLNIGDDAPGFTDTVTQGLKRNTNIKKYLGTVKMPVPNQLNTANGVSWGEGRANAFEAASFLGAFKGIRGAMTGNIGVQGLLKGAAGEAANLGGTLLGGGAPDANILLASAASRAALASININTDPNQFITRATGKAINPNLELLFAGPKLRSFQFSFQFAPQNPDDAAITRRIMRFFKQGMLPSRAASSDLFLMSPNVFRLAFMNGAQKIRSLNSFKMCALTTCQINFTPDGTYQAYDDPSVISQPVRSQMTLGFTELTPIFHDDYDMTSSRASLFDLQRKVQEDGPLQDGLSENLTDTTVQAANDIGY